VPQALHLTLQLLDRRVLVFDLFVQTVHGALSWATSKALGRRVSLDERQTLLLPQLPLVVEVNLALGELPLRRIELGLQFRKI
jgi:hypothetical protein